MINADATVDSFHTIKWDFCTRSRNRTSLCWPIVKKTAFQADEEEIFFWWTENVQRREEKENHRKNCNRKSIFLLPHSLLFRKPPPERLLATLEPWAIYPFSTHHHPLHAHPWIESWRRIICISAMTSRIKRTGKVAAKWKAAQTSWHREYFLLQQMHRAF